MSRFASLFIFLLPAACREMGVHESEDVSSRDISVAVTVNGGADRTEIRAEALARLPYSGRLELTGGDRFVVHGDPSNVLQLSPEGDLVATAPGNAGRFAVDLLRVVDHSMSDLGADLPPPFVLEPLPASVAWSAPIALQWNAAAGDYTTSVLVESSCSKPFARALAKDTGSYLINGGEIERLDRSATCKVTVSVVRTAKTVSTPGLYARATQTRSFALEITP